MFQPFEGFWLRFTIILIVWIIVIASIAYTILKRDARRRLSKKH